MPSLPAMVTKIRSVTLGASAGVMAVAGEGGSSEGHRKTRSTRACGPARRCILKRIAAGGTLKATPATVIGSDGASAETGLACGQSM